MKGRAPSRRFALAAMLFARVSLTTCLSHCLPCLTVLLAGKFSNRVPVLLGSNHDEGVSFNPLPKDATAAMAAALVDRTYPAESADEILAMVRPSPSHAVRACRQRSRYLLPVLIARRACVCARVCVRECSTPSQTTRPRSTP